MKPSFLQRLSLAVKALTVERLPDVEGSSWDSPLPGAEKDYAALAGDLWRNSAVMACIAWIQRAFPEPVLQVKGADGEGKEQTVPDHPAGRLVTNPNPYYSGDHLWSITVSDFVREGNAYWAKARNRYGRVSELWHLPVSAVTPKWPVDGSEFVAYYEYRVNGGLQRLAREDVIHFRNGADPANERLGISPLKAGLREIVSDNQATTYTAAILRNSGSSPGVFSPKETTDVDDKTRASFLAAWRKRFTGENAGQPMLTDGQWDFTKTSFTPEEMALDRLRTVPEDRICALIGLSPMVVGLTSGAQHKTFANYKEAREAALESCIIPMQKLLAQELTQQLLVPDFDGKGMRFAWDYTDVAALQEDRDALYKRFSLAYQAGGITRAEFREKLGLPFTEQDAVYFVEPGGGEALPPEPAPAE